MADIETLHLTRVYRSDKDKNGQTLMGRSGRPYTKIAIKATEYGDKWINGFGNRDNNRWQDGDVVKARVVQSGQYLNLEMVSELEQVMLKLDEMSNKLDMAIKGAKVQQQPDYLTGTVAKDNVASSPGFPEYAKPEINDEDIPF